AVEILPSTVTHQTVHNFTFCLDGALDIRPENHRFSASSVLDNSGGLRYNTLNVVIKGYYALNLKEGKMSWQIRNIF
ncbi:hypothetical protein AALB64_00005, partial [Lachnospiraceae bacterium 45-P1]